MNTAFSENFKELRKDRGLSQDKLATAFSVSVQAVSKWECSLSYPDIELLPIIADYLDVSIDFLLRRRSVTPNNPIPDLNLPNDNVLRVVQCIGNTIIRQDKYDPKIYIPLAIDRSVYENNNNLNLEIEIWGNTNIEGDVSGYISAGDGVNCGNVGGYISAGDGVNCGNVNGNISAGDGVNCGNVSGDITAGDDVNCSNVDGDVNAGNSIHCGDISKNVLSCGEDLHCKTINGSVTCSGDIYYDN